MKNGKFITFEGPEGAGKSTQIKMLGAFLERSGISCVITREPGGTPLAEELRNIVKGFSGSECVHPETELLLMDPEDKLGRMLHTFSGTAYEIAEFTSDNLKKYHFIASDPGEFIL